MNESFDAVFKLDKDTELRDTRNDTRECIADKLLHVLDFLHIRRIALSFDRHALAARCVLSNAREHGRIARLLFNGHRARLKCLTQKAMDDEIRIAANR